MNKQEREDRNKAIISRREEGASYPVIAQEFGMHPVWLAKMVRQIRPDLKGAVQKHDELVDGIVVKACSQCHQKFPATEDFFRKQTAGRYGVTSWCRGCERDWHRNEYHSNIEEGRDSRRASYQKHKEKRYPKTLEWRKANPDKLSEYDKNYAKRHPEKIKAKQERQKERRRENPEKFREYDRRRLSIPRNRISHSMSRSMRTALVRGKNGYHWETLVDYTLDDLMEHLESLFLPGMDWTNYGMGTGKWCIDHIKPKSLFHFESYNDPEFKECWALNNLQPLWWEDNNRKHAKWEEAVV